MKIFLQKRRNLHFLINHFFYGDPFAYRAYAERNPSILRIDSIPYVNLLGVIRGTFDEPIARLSDLRFMLTVGWSNLLLFLVTVAFAAVASRLPLPYVVYAVSYLLFVSSINWAHGTHRYLLLLFPLFMGLGRVRSMLFFLSTALLSGSLMLYLASYFVEGRYAY